MLTSCTCSRIEHLKRVKKMNWALLKSPSALKLPLCAGSGEGAGPQGSIVRNLT